MDVFSSLRVSFGIGRPSQGESPPKNRTREFPLIRLKQPILRLCSSMLSGTVNDSRMARRISKCDTFVVAPGLIEISPWKSVLKVSLEYGYGIPSDRENKITNQKIWKNIPVEFDVYKDLMLMRKYPVPLPN